MTVNELRNGNIVLFNNKTYILDNFDIYKLETTNCEDIDPIELTEEILLKCGFVKTNRKIEIQMSLNTFEWYSSSPNFIFIDIDGNSDIGIECESLHKLQNLYYAITNEELQINL